MRIRVFTIVTLFFFVALTLGLFYTQILKYNFYKELSENNRIRVISLEAPRGKIFDKNGRLLVSNRISFDVEVVFQEIKNIEKVINILGDILSLDRKKLAERMERARKRPFVPVKIVRDVPKDKAIRIEEIRSDLTGVIVTTRPLRNYIYKDTLSHLLGYLGEISEDELERYRTYGYRMQDFVGKDGVERSYNEYLKGQNGGEQIEVDNKGRQLRILAIKQPRPGKDIYLTLDMELQGFCDSLLAKRRGAIIVFDPSTGAVLAMVSRPNFDPNIFVSSNNFKEISRLLNDSEASPMLNRAISCAYPPGSIFKVVVATAALDSGKFNGEKTFPCQGFHYVGDRIFRCWKEKGHGTLRLKEAVKYSCNVFFYQLGLLAGADKISEYAFEFGLGRPTGIDLPGEIGGFVPTASWKRKELKEPWFKGETANYAIGQGYLLFTPIQIARLFSAIANGGRLIEPYVVDRIEYVKLPHAEGKKIKVSDKVLLDIKEATRMVVNDSYGTGLYARSEDIVISGKTGTAENPKGEPHAWFAGFAPFEDPKVCVAVFLEHGGKGGLDPAHFTKMIVEEARRLKLL